MSLDCYTFVCSKCGHVEEQHEGMHLFESRCFYMFYCKICNKVQSLALTEEEYKTEKSPRCCGEKMTFWDKHCSQCNEKMELKSWYSDTI